MAQDAGALRRSVSWLTSFAARRPTRRCAGRRGRPAAAAVAEADAVARDRPFTGIVTTKADSAPAASVGMSSGARPLVRNDPSAPNRNTVAVRLTAGDAAARILHPAAHRQACRPAACVRAPAARVAPGRSRTWRGHPGRRSAGERNRRDTEPDTRSTATMAAAMRQARAPRRRRSGAANRPPRRWRRSGSAARGRRRLGLGEEVVSRPSATSDRDPRVGAAPFVAQQPRDDDRHARRQERATRG